MPRRFSTRDTRTGRRDPDASIISFMPLLDPDLPTGVVGRLVGWLESPRFHRPHTEEHFIISSFDLRARRRQRQRQ